MFKLSSSGPCEIRRAHWIPCKNPEGKWFVVSVSFLTRELRACARASYRFKAVPRWPDMKNGYRHAVRIQLFLGAYLHGKCVMLLACERVITCRVCAFTLFRETPWRVTYIISGQKVTESWQSSLPDGAHTSSTMPEFLQLWKLQYFQ